MLGGDLVVKWALMLMWLVTVAGENPRGRSVNSGEAVVM
jgi:hypothetical protein